MQNDPEIRTKAQEKIIALLLGLIEEGRQQGQVSMEISEEALRIYFVLFMDAFTQLKVLSRLSCTDQRFDPRLFRETFRSAKRPNNMKM